MHAYTMEYYSAMRKKETLPFYDNMDEPWRHYAKWNVRQRKINNVWYYLYVESKKAERIETENNWWLPGPWGGGNGEKLVKGY